MLEPKPRLEDILLYGTLPGIMLEINNELRETDLYSYVTTYLEEEIRSEALVRNLGSFSRFLEIAAGESGKQLNFTRLSHDIGISDTTIANYYQILEDCLITLRIDPMCITQTMLTQIGVIGFPVIMDKCSCAGIIDICQRLQIIEEKNSTKARELLMRIVAMLTKMAKTSD